MEDRQLAQSELSPKRRLTVILLILVPLGICLILLTVSPPTQAAVENFLQSSLLLSKPTRPETPTANTPELSTPVNALVCTPTNTSGTEEATNTETPQNQSGDHASAAQATTSEPFTPTVDIRVGNGRCLDPCDPGNSNCLAGLKCLASGSGNSSHICWNSIICVVATRTPERTLDITCNFDGVCDPGERAACPDCNINQPCDQQQCGDGVCSSCPVDVDCAADCEACTTNTCGDGVCHCGETLLNCASDCSLCSDSTCGDGTCQLICGETPSSCSADCGSSDPCAGATCGDGNCQLICGETPSSCSADCGSSNPCASATCGDGNCQMICGETPSSCSADCGSSDPCAGAVCGDGNCQLICGETPVSCSADCGNS